MADSEAGKATERSEEHSNDPRRTAGLTPGVPCEDVKKDIATNSNRSGIAGRFNTSPEALVTTNVQGWVWEASDLLPQRRLILLWLANPAERACLLPG